MIQNNSDFCVFYVYAELNQKIDFLNGCVLSLSFILIS